MGEQLPKAVKEAVVLVARNWPKNLDAECLLRELDLLARLVYAAAKDEAAGR